MRILEITKSTYHTNTRVTASIDVRGKRRELYMQLPAENRSFIHADATAFIALSFIPGIRSGDAVSTDLPVSQQFVSGLMRVSKFYKDWAMNKKNIRFKTKFVLKERIEGKYVGLFFSGGVDSLYTLLKNLDGSKGITHIFFVHGMDIPLKNKELYSKSLQNYKKLEKIFNIKIIPIQTNFREFTDSLTDWEFGHGPVMFALGLLLRKGFKKIYISGGMHIDHLRPLSTHPHVDHLFSTENLRFVHFGADVDRLEKVTFISKYKVILSMLRVCWRNSSGQYNCCECEKCLRTMLSLYNCGVLSDATSFPKPINLKKLAKTKVTKNGIRYFRENLLALSVTEKNSPLARALEACVSYNENRNPKSEYISRFRFFLSSLDAKYLNSKMFYYASQKGLVK